MTDLTMTALIGPAIGVILLVGGWLVAGGRDTHGQPIRGRVRAGEWLAIGGWVVGVATLPTDLDPSLFPVSLAVWIALGLCMIRGAGRRSQGWTTIAEISTSAAALAWTQPRRVLASLMCAAAGLGLAVWLAGQGHPLAGVLGASVCLAPARWRWGAGARRERARTGVEIATAGAWRGAEWDSHEAERRSAPIRVGFRDDAQPCRVTAPLPPAWRATSLEADRAELRERLSAWGGPWSIAMDASRRRICAALCEPLPTYWAVPKDRSFGWINANRPSPLALYLGEAQDADVGASFPLWWDPDASDPHALLGGKTKKGKTVGLQLLVGQAIERGWDVIVVDPKGVDFVWAGRLPGVRYFPGRDCLAGLAEAVGEMEERQAWLQKRLWSGKDGSDEQGDLLKVPAQPYKPCLVIVDEAAEVSNLGDKEAQKLTADHLSSLARLSRFAGIVCAFCTQRPDVKFLSGETKSNLGVRVLFGSAGPTLTNMVLEIASRDLGALTAQCRGRGRAVVAEGLALEFQGGFISPATVKAIRGVLPPDRLTPIRFAPEPEWRKWVREGRNDGLDPANLVHPDYDRVSRELAAAEAAADAKLTEGKTEVERSRQSGKKGKASPRKDRAEGRTDDGEQSSSDSEDYDSGSEPSTDPNVGLPFDPFADFEDGR